MAANSNIPAGQASNMTPDYEVKLLLKPDTVLNSGNELTSTVLAAFDVLPGVINQTIQYLNTNEKHLYSKDWSARVHKTENEDGLELTYKKRYAITANNIDATLTKANDDGFNASEGKYDAQVEWGGMDLPEELSSRSMLIEEAPTKFDNWLYDKWGTGILASSRVFGPVYSKRYVGRWEGTKMYLEVWPLRNSEGTGYEYLVEASLKTETYMEASKKHASLMSHLQGKGWFLEQDSLRTQLIMERY
ncbi:unnamed protein product [Fusarium graminearum]|uniref:CYTH domain-containing protein n=1 Tax=Gibberella zeae TaxID=5518 RepID=A0A4E9E122_GIBZA|nr:unnamed protein product [Fusarium graminearum]